MRRQNWTSEQESERARVSVGNGSEQTSGPTFIFNVCTIKLHTLYITSRRTDFLHVLELPLSHKKKAEDGLNRKERGFANRFRLGFHAMNVEWSASVSDFEE